MNLIENVEAVKFSFFEKPPASSMSKAFVYVNAENNYQVVKNGDRLTRSEVRVGKYTKVYTVNMSTLSFQYENEVPSADRGRRFFVDLSIDYKVIDPISVIQQDAGEIVNLLRKKLPYWLEEITCDYPINEAKRVKQHIEDLHEYSSMAAGLKQVGVIVTDINVLVKQSINDQQHDTEFRRIDQQYELEDYRSEKQHQIHQKQRIHKRIDARDLANEIQASIEAGDFLTALLIAEENEEALQIVKNRILHEEKFRREVRYQAKKSLLDPTVDEIEAKKQMAKIQAYFPYEQTIINQDERTSNSLDDLSRAYQTIQVKGE
jgi:hypothetical protein